MPEAKLPPSTPEGAIALREARRRAYEVKRSHDFRCALPRCRAGEQIVVVVIEGEWTTRCVKHLEAGMERVPGQWIDAPPQGLRAVK